MDSAKPPSDEDRTALAQAEAAQRAAQIAQDQHPPAHAKMAPPAEGAGPPLAATVEHPQSDGERPRARERPPGHISEADILAARVEGMAVTLRDMARVALAAVALAVVALLVSLYVLRLVRGSQAPA
jgi:hypothetical protein